MSGRTVRAALWLALAAACAGIQSHTHSYATLAEAEAAGAVAAGWLPAELPPGTREIRVAYVPKGRERWGLFNFPPAEREHLERLLAPEEVSLDGLRPGVPARIEWWPVALRGALDGETLAVTGLRGYRTRDGHLIMAVQWNQGRAYFWNDAAGSH